MTGTPPGAFSRVLAAELAAVPELEQALEDRTGTSLVAARLRDRAKSQPFADFTHLIAVSEKFSTRCSRERADRNDFLGYARRFLFRHCIAQSFVFGSRHFAYFLSTTFA